MKRINLTENDIFNIVNRVINEQSAYTKTPQQLIQRFLLGDKTVKPNIPAIKDRTFSLKDKRGLNKDLMQFIVKNVEFIDTQSKGTTARVRGIIAGQTEPETQETVFELTCGSFGDFKLIKYRGLTGKEPETGETKPTVLSKSKVPNDVVRFTYVSDPFVDEPDPTLEDSGGLGIFFYMDTDVRLPHRGGVDTSEKWLNLYDGENKIKKELNFLEDRYGAGGTVFYLYPFDSSVDNNTALTAMFNYIKPQVAQDFADYGVKKAPSDYMDKRKYKYQIIETKGRPFQLNAGKSLATPNPVSADYKVIILQYY
jgi:hypothetical protein